MPALAAIVRRQELPSDVLVLIRIAAGCRGTCTKAAAQAGERPDFVRKAAILYLQQVLFFPEADSYRVLGVRPGVSQAALSAHFRWMMRWLHPDRDHGGWECAFAPKVVAAWNDLKSPEARARYDHRHAVQRRREARLRGAAGSGRLRLPWVAIPLDGGSARPPWRPSRALGVLAALIVLLVPGPNVPSPWSSPVGADEGIQAESEISDSNDDDGAKTDG